MRSKPGARARVVLAVVVVAAAVGTTPAWGAGTASNRASTAGANVALTPDPFASPLAREAIDQFVKRARARVDAAREQRQTPDAARERSRSRGEFTGVSRGGAKSLFDDRFGQLLADKSVTSAERVDEAGTITAYLDDRTARVKLAGKDKTVLAAATTPLRAVDDGSRRKEPVDLTLSQDQSGFVSANPLVDANLPSTADQPVSLSELGVGLSARGASGASAEPTDDKRAVIYPDTFKDADLILAPIERGLEVAVQIRGPEAPEAYTIDVKRLPAGAFLRAAGKGAEVVDDTDKVIAAIDAPTVIDAQGAELPASLAVEGTTFVLKLAHRQRDVAYPLLLDPAVTQSFTSSANAYGWAGRSAPPSWDYWAVQGGCASGLPCYQWAPSNALYIYGRPGVWYPNGSYGEWVYNVPHLNNDDGQGEPSTYIVQTDFHQMGINCYGSNTGYPYIIDGIYSAHVSFWTGYYAWPCGYQNISFTNGPGINVPSPDTTYGKQAAFALGFQYAMSRPTWADGVLGSAVVYMDDQEGASIGSVVHSVSPETWTKGTSNRSVTATSVTDQGLGAKYLNVYTGPGDDPNTSTWAWTGEQVNDTCVGNSASPCRRTWTPTPSNPSDVEPTATYTTSNLPEGVTRYHLAAFDPTYDTWTRPPAWDVKIDRSAPTLTLGGSISDARNNRGYVRGDTGTLTVSAQDTYSGIAQLNVTVDGRSLPGYPKTQTADGGSITDNLSYDFADELPHVFELMGVDRAGNPLPSQTFTVSADKSPPIVTGDAAWVGPDADGGLVQADDTGAGMATLSLTPTGGSSTDFSSGCRSGEVSVCEKQLVGGLDPDDLPDGSTTVSAMATDDSGRTTTTGVTLRIDKTSPVTQLSGTLTTSPASVLAQPTYNLHIDSSDPRSGITDVEVRVDDQPVLVSSQSAATSMSRDFVMNTAGFSNGPHSVAVTTTDAVGNTDEQSFDVVVNYSGAFIAAALGAALRDEIYVGSNAGTTVRASGSHAQILGASPLGISSLEVNEVNGPRLGSVTPPGCPQLCPDRYTGDVPVDVSPVPEGRHTLQVTARDVTGSAASGPFVVAVDRTAPDAPSDLGLSDYDTTSRVAVVRYESQPDRLLRDGSAGAGLDTVEFRYRVAGGPWTTWAPDDDDEVSIPDVGPGQVIEFQTRATDLVGNVSASSAASFTAQTVSSDVPEFPTEAAIASDGAAVAVTWEDRDGYQNQLVGIPVRLQGPAGYDRTVLTDRTGKAYFPNLPTGSYQATPVQTSDGATVSGDQSFSHTAGQFTQRSYAVRANPTAQASEYPQYEEARACARAIRRYVSDPVQITRICGRYIAWGLRARRIASILFGYGDVPPDSTRANSFQHGFAVGAITTVTRVSYRNRPLRMALAYPQEREAAASRPTSKPPIRRRAFMDRHNNKIGFNAGRQRNRLIRSVCVLMRRKAFRARKIFSLGYPNPVSVPSSQIARKLVYIVPGRQVDPVGIFPDNDPCTYALKRRS